MSDDQPEPKKPKTMGKITEGVEFDTLAREWRCKWDPEDDKKSLQEAQKILDSFLAELKGVDGVQSVQRVVCGGCLDFKIITSMSSEKFEVWEENKFAPEEKFLEQLKATEGLEFVETQTYTLMSM